MTAPRAMQSGPINSIQAAFDGTIEVNKYDLMFYDSNDVKPASSLADLLTEPLNQRGFARRFAGVAMDTRKSTDTQALTDFPVATDIKMEYDCTSSTFEVGDLVAAVEIGAGTALEDQKVKKTTDTASAIGIVTKRYGSATTRVECRLISRVFSHAVEGGTPGFPASGCGSAAETLTGTRTLTLNDARVLALDPGGAGRTVNLPDEATSVGVCIIIFNTADAAEVLTIKDSASSATICTPTQNECAILICDGTVWRGLVGASN